MANYRRNRPTRRSPMPGRLPDRLDCLRNDDIDTHLPELRGGAARVAVDALRDVRLAGRAKSVGPNQIGRDCERQRRVGQSGMRADFFIAVATPLQGLNVRGLGGTVVLLDRVHACPLRLPFAIEAARDGQLVFLVATMIAEQDDVAKAGPTETPRRVFERFFERRVGNRDGSGNRMCCVGGSTLPSGT